MTSFSVSARNSAPNSLATWNEADGSGIPAGAPVAVGGVSASITEGTTTANAGWQGAFSDNGRAISDYWAVITDGTAPACTVTGVDSGNGVVSPPSGAQHFGSG
ncbi:hypothetical protein, partial [Mesorhizobium japonicum]|uniref:hypothetical protein n=1 Tax=Mesorhizobium japonicum TaxID=2066070 RepID=UPI003B5988E0